MRKYLIPWWKIDLGRNEIKKIKESMLNRHITQGPVTEKLEKQLAKLLSVPYVILTTSGSTALLMALLAYKIKPGDEVIIPNLTFVATAQAPLLLGAKVRLVDVECSRPLIDIKQIEKVITSKTKAIIPVHLNGKAADIKGINRLAAKYNLKVIEDSVQALCSRNKLGYLGTQADLGVFSLGITKLITTIQGGFIVIKNKDIFERLKKIRNHGILSQSSSCFKDAIPGFNFKFNDILAAIGLSQTQKAKKKSKSLKNIYRFYKRELRDLDYIKLIEVNLKQGELPLWVETVCAEREKVIALLQAKNIQTKSFFPSCCEYPYLKSKGDCRNSKFYAKYGLILPSGPDQKIEDLVAVVKALKDISKDIKVRSPFRL